MKTSRMKKISKALKITGLISICLWIIGSVFLYRENNGKITIVITAIIIIAGLYSQITKDRKVNTELLD
jgi:uncharacterized membrane protein